MSNLLLMNNNILDKILNKYSIKEQDISCIENVGEMPIKRAIEVYNDNYNIQNMLGETVFYGYEELLNNLRTSTLEEVYLYVLELSKLKKHFLQMKEKSGILIIFVMKGILYLIE